MPNLADLVSRPPAIISGPSLHLADEDDLYVLRARIAQELKPIIDRVVLNRDREIRLVLKPTEGYRAEMEMRNGRFETLRLIDLDTGEVTSIDRFLFLSMQHYMAGAVEPHLEPER